MNKGLLFLLSTVLVVSVSSFIVFSKELGLANTVRKECLFEKSCDVPLSNLYKSLDWDTLCYATYRPRQQEEKEYGCEFCRIVTLMKLGEEIYMETEEYVMEPRLAKSGIFIPEHLHDGSGVKCFARNDWKVRGVKSKALNIFKQDIYFFKT